MDLSAFSTSRSSKSHFSSALEELQETLEAIRPLESQLEAVAKTTLQSLLAGNKLLFCGNGGSASDSSHIACEFTCRFCDDRRPYPAMALAAEPGLLTAIGNDYHFDHLFERQVTAFGKPGDILFGISSSGNSMNILRALQEGRSRKLITVAILGRDGGKAAGVADHQIIVPGQSTARIQEVQKFLLHLLCEMVEQELPA